MCTYKIICKLLIIDKKKVHSLVSKISRLLGYQ